jgi:hypothetical protein
MTHRPTGQQDNVKKNKNKNSSSSAAGATMDEISEEEYAAIVEGKRQQRIEWWRQFTYLEQQECFQSEGAPEDT